jgi:predicted phage terminase large subunit-like protein
VSGQKVGSTRAAKPRSPWWRAGHLWLPDPRRHGRLVPGREWVEDFIDQLTAFPTAAHDDDVDAFTQLVAQ